MVGAAAFAADGVDDRGFLFERPFIVAGDIDCELAAEAGLLVRGEVDVGAGEGAVGGVDEVVEAIPSGGCGVLLLECGGGGA